MDGGQHTEYVCRNLLAMKDELFVALLADGVFECATILLASAGEICFNKQN